MHINENQHLYAWQANTCMLSKDHPSYSCDSHETELVQIDDHYKPKPGAILPSLAEADEQKKDFEIVHEEWPEADLQQHSEKKMKKLLERSIK